MIDLPFFFKEKEIPYTVWEIEHLGNLHVVDSKDIIELILSMNNQEQHTIACRIFYLDFFGVDILSYLHSLAKHRIATINANMLST